MLSKIIKKVASKKLLGVPAKGTKKKNVKAAKDKAKSIKVDSSNQKVRDARKVKKGLKIQLGGKGKDAKAKPVGTPTQRAKGDTISSLKNQIIKAKNYTEYKKLSDKLEKLYELKDKRKLSGMSKQKRFDELEDRYMQEKINAMGEPKFAKGGYSAKKKMMGGGYAMKRRKK